MKEKVNILVVDDEEVVRESLVEWLREEGYNAEAAGDGFKALEKLEERNWDIALVDLKMPKMDGLELLEKIKQESPGTQVIIFTAYATVHSAVQAIKKGAYDYLVKPVDPEEVSLLIERLLKNQELLKEVSFLRKELTKQYRFHDLVSKSPKMQKIFELARTVAKSNSNILILGESGTGKELLARAIHNESPRASGPFVAVSCVAITDTLLESELFGHEKGAFTDAIAQKKGKFELAHGGTLFLDEIGDISPKMQLTLLRVLEEKEFTRVGGTKLIKVDVRIIAATNRDLQKAVQEGRFRDDLYYRLNVITIQLPPLRERKEDIPLLVQHFIEKFKADKCNCHLTLAKVPDPSRFGVPEIKGNRIIRVEEKPAQPKSDFAVAGIYIYDYTIFEAVNSIKPSSRGELEISDAHQYLIDKGYKITYSEITGWWKDTGKPSDLLEANRLVLSNLKAKSTGQVDKSSHLAGTVILQKNSQIINSHIRGPAIIGENTIIENSYIGPYTSIYHDCIVRNSEIEFSIVADHCKIENVGIRIESSILGSEVEITKARGKPRTHRFILGNQSLVELV